MAAPKLRSLTVIWPLIRITALLFAAQIAAMFLNFGSLITGTPVNQFIVQEVLHSPPVLTGLAAFAAAQLVLYAGFVFCIWLITRLIGRLFAMRIYSMITLGLLIWADAVITVYLANQIFFPNSQFATLLRSLSTYIPYFQTLSSAQTLDMIFLGFGGLLLFAVAIAAVSLLIFIVQHFKAFIITVLLLLAMGGGGYYYYLKNLPPAPIEVTVPAETSAPAATSAPVAPSSAPVAPSSAPTEMSAPAATSAPAAPSSAPAETSAPAVISAPVAPTAMATQPNVVYLSIDYFRPGDTVYYGSQQELTPNVDSFLSQATVFKHTLSVIARTFPSLMSVESGTYPKKNGARHNLIMPSRVDQKNTLGNILQKQGYYTMLATDGSHFFYMTPNYGFNRVIAPEPGLNEFLLASLNDFPLSNLIINTPIGKKLFPYNYMNRNANVTYTPSTFNSELQRALLNRPQNKPLYLHAHLTLAAWPYTWSPRDVALPQGLTKPQQARYKFNVGLHAVDQQFAQVMDMLQQQHILDNAIVVVFSDHGQAFGEEGDRVTIAKNYVGTPNKADIARFTKLSSAVGHGTDVLSLKQAHPLLAFKLYGAMQNQPGPRDFTASLIDISPTVLDYLHLPRTTMQGVSLLPDITMNQATGIGDRPIFIETEFTLPSILTADPSITKVLDEGIGYYQLDKATGMLEVKPMFTRLIIKGKQRAVVQGSWMLAMYPNANKAATLVLVDLANRQWTTDLQSSFAQSSPLPQLLSELQQFYGDEVDVPTLPAAPAIAENAQTDATPASASAPAPTSAPATANAAVPVSPTAAVAAVNTRG